MLNDDFSKLIQCDPKVFYTKSPLNLKAVPQSAGTIKFFVSEHFYPMPEQAKNPMCWTHRCDHIWKDFSRHNPGEDEDVFWATVQRWIPVVCFLPLVVEERLVKEVKTINGREKHCWHWKEHTYEIRRIGYKGRPPNPWKQVEDELPKKRVD